MRLGRLVWAFCAVLLLTVTIAEARKLKVGYLQSDIHHLPFWVAMEKGFFQREGIEVEVGGIFKAGPEEMSAFAAGALDAGYVGIAPTITAYANKTADVRVVAQANKEGSAVVVKKDAEITDAKGLRGKSIAIPGYSTVQDFLLRRTLEKESLAPDTLKIIILKPPEMIPALQQGQIDGFVAWEPFPAKALSQGVGKTLYRSGIIWPNHPCCCLVVQAELLKKEPAAVKSLVKAHFEAVKFINQEKEEAIKIASKFTGLDEPTIRKSLENVIYDHVAAKAPLKEYVNYLNRYNYIKIDDPDKVVQNLVDETFIQELSK